MARWIVLGLILASLLTFGDFSKSVSTDEFVRDIVRLAIDRKSPVVPPYYPILSVRHNWLGKDSGKCPSFVFKEMFAKKTPFATAYVKSGGDVADFVQASQLYGKTEPNQADWINSYLQNAKSGECRGFLKNFMQLDQKYRNEYISVVVKQMKIVASEAKQKRGGKNAKNKKKKKKFEKEIKRKPEKDKKKVEKETEGKIEKRKKGMPSKRKNKKPNIGKGKKTRIGKTKKPSKGKGKKPSKIKGKKNRKGKRRKPSRRKGKKSRKGKRRRPSRREGKKIRKGKRRRPSRSKGKKGRKRKGKKTRKGKGKRTRKGKTKNPRKDEETKTGRGKPRNPRAAVSKKKTKKSQKRKAKGETSKEACVGIGTSRFSSGQFKGFIHKLSSVLANTAPSLAKAKGGKCIYAAMQRMVPLCFFHRLNVIFHQRMCSALEN